MSESAGANLRRAADADLLDQVVLAQPVSPRPAWVEVDLGRLRDNFACLNRDKSESVAVLSVVKDNAYGHGLVPVARAAVAAGARFLGVNTVSEAGELRAAGVEAPLLMLGERHPDELAFCLQHRVTVSVGDLEVARVLDRLAESGGMCVPVHLKFDTGMSRFGFRWDTAEQVGAEFRRLPRLVVEGVMSHFAMSDELDKTFARVQLGRFREVLDRLGGRVGLRHLCNTGGYLDLPEAHFDMVRLGILPLGVYPSAVCRRIPGIEPAMTVKARVVTVRMLQVGETYGYGMRYRAETRRRIGVLPVGYGDGYPRLRNEGCVLVRGRRAPVIGGVAMDSMGIDLTDIPDARVWDEAVLQGRQGDQEISVHDIAGWQRTVSYDILAGWRSRLPRVYIGVGRGAFP